MPFLWKKMKNNRISKLVNDHLQSSQKRRDGSSLVVETGFPTSLIDFYIKNREKLKKPSKKKRQSQPVVTPAIDEDLGNDEVMSGQTTCLSSPLGPPSPPANTPLCCCSSPTFILPLPSDEDVNDAVPALGNVSEVAGDEKEGYGGGMVVDGKNYRAFSMVSKIFLVVMLVLGTKRLALGVTISAFFLFLLDYMRKNVGRYFRPCAEAKSFLRLLMVEKVWRLLRFKEDRLIENKSGVLRMEVDEDEFVRPCSSSSIRSSVSRYDHVKEIEDVAAKESSVVSHVYEVRREKEIMEDTKIVELKEIVPEKEESLYEGSVAKRKTCRRATSIKSKMKKFVANKLKMSRKVHEFEKPVVLTKDKNVRIKALEPSPAHVDRSEELGSAGSRLSSCSTLTQKEDDNMVLAGAFNPVSEVNEQKIATNAREGISKIQNAPSFRYLLMLCLIILIGLVQSRVIAIVLASSCCLLLKQN